MKDWVITHKLYILLSLIIVLGLGVYYFYLHFDSASQKTNNGISMSNQLNKNQIDQKEKADIPKVAKTIVVDLKGEVKNPGVYSSNVGDRVIDVINKAGGLTNNADESQVNLAEHVQDEMVIMVPPKGSTAAVSEGAAKVEKGNSTQSNKINLNKADESQLENLPGIGPSKAEAIISFREEQGGFRSIDDLKKITGIGDKTFEKLKESITVK